MTAAITSLTSLLDSRPQPQRPPASPLCTLPPAPPSTVLTFQSGAVHTHDDADQIVQHATAPDCASPSRLRIAGPRSCATPPAALSVRLVMPPTLHDPLKSHASHASNCVFAPRLHGRTWAVLSPEIPYLFVLEIAKEHTELMQASGRSCVISLLHLLPPYVHPLPFLLFPKAPLRLSREPSCHTMTSTATTLPPQPCPFHAARLRISSRIRLGASLVALPMSHFPRGRRKLSPDISFILPPIPIFPFHLRS
ncbi:hypothetical protein C8R45DRAFT_1224418 [Mycena sanguinolenta]|nr:hypothetical protein C8R45DRAFT_1224418 [Mycena sanguinolenta]